MARIIWPRIPLHGHFPVRDVSLPEGKPPFSHGFSYFSHGFSYGFPIFPLVFLWFSYFPIGIPMVFLFSHWYSYGFPMVSHYMVKITAITALSAPLQNCLQQPGSNCAKSVHPGVPHVPSRS